MTFHTELDAQAFAELRRPFIARAIKFRLLEQPKSPRGSARAVAHIDARHVIERLNAVAGSGWSHTYGPFDRGSVTCHLTVLDVEHTDVGGDDMGVKGAYSDALKRSAVHFGVGLSLYAMPKVWIPAASLLRVDHNRWALTDATTDTLAQSYEDWVTSPAVAKRFGEVAGHGETTETIGAPPEQEAWADPDFPTAEHNAAEARFLGVAGATARQRGVDVNGLADRALTAVGVPTGGDGTWRLRHARAQQLEDAADLLSPPPTLLPPVPTAGATAAAIAGQ